MIRDVTIPTRRFERLLRRRPRMLAATVAASAMLFGIATAGHAAGVEAETRATLAADASRVAASIANTTETGTAVVAAHFSAATCVIDVSKRLAPVVAGGSKYAASSLGVAATVVQRASDAAPVPAYDPAPPSPLSARAGVDELEAALAVLRDAEEDAEAEVAGLASEARRAEQDCAAGEAALASLVAEITRRTDELVAANPKAAADVVTALTARRDAVVANDAGAVERWLAAAGAVESSHVAAVLAEQQAAERAATDAARSGSSTGQQPSSGAGPAPLAHPDWRVLTPEEVAALGMPPGSFIQEVPPGYYPLPPLDLG
jgi:hypothetical protein